MLLTEARISEVIKIYFNKLKITTVSPVSLTFARIFHKRGSFCCLVERLSDACTNILYIWSLTSAGLKMMQ